MLEISDWARDIVTRAHAAATRFNPDAKIRLARTGPGVEAVLVERPEPDDERIDVGGATLYVERGLEGLLDVEEPHDRIVLRPTGSSPNVRGHGEGVR